MVITFKKLLRNRTVVEFSQLEELLIDRVRPIYVLLRSTVDLPVVSIPYHTSLLVPGTVPGTIPTRTLVLVLHSTRTSKVFVTVDHLPQAPGSKFRPPNGIFACVFFLSLGLKKCH